MAALRKDHRSYEAKPVEDLNGAAWLAPVILTANGDRAFRVSYGADWLPALTIGQQRAVAVTSEARQVLMGMGDVSESIVCQWAAELLCLTHHLVPEVIAQLGLMDSALAIGALSAATSLPLKREVPA